MKYLVNILSSIEINKDYVISESNKNILITLKNVFYSFIILIITFLIFYFIFKLILKHKNIKEHDNILELFIKFSYVVTLCLHIWYLISDLSFISIPFVLLWIFSIYPLVNNSREYYNKNKNKFIVKLFEIISFAFIIISFLVCLLLISDDFSNISNIISLPLYGYGNYGKYIISSFDLFSVMYFLTYIFGLILIIIKYCKEFSYRKGDVKWN